MPKVVKREMEQPEKTAGKAAAPPAYFLSLTVENFRCFGEQQTLDLSDGKGRPMPWTIILGDNGVGKTTLLQCLAAMQPQVHWDREVFFPNMRAVHKERVMSMKRSPFDARKQEEDMLVGCSIYQGAKIKDHNIGKIIGDYYYFDTGKWVEIGDAKDNIQGLVCYGYGASRRMGQTALSNEEEPDTCASLFSDEIGLLNAEEWLLLTDYTAKSSLENSSIAANQRERIKGLLIPLLPDVEEIKFGAFDKKTRRPSVQVKTPYGWIAIRALSLGYQTIIAWMVDLASRLFDRYPNSKNPLGEPAIVLIDEIDLHLHPRWQRKLIQHLSDLFPNTQFIATAHSPLVVQAAYDANIVLLRREGDHVVIDNDVKAISGWRVDQVLTSDLFGLPSARPPQLDDLIIERNNILAKSHLTKADREKINGIEKKMAHLPIAESLANMKAMDIIREAAKLLEPEGSRR